MTMTDNLTLHLIFVKYLRREKGSRNWYDTDISLKTYIFSTSFLIDKGAGGYMQT